MATAVAFGSEDSFRSKMAVSFGCDQAGEVAFGGSLLAQQWITTIASLAFWSVVSAG